jgi:hypothetical protein
VALGVVPGGRLNDTPTWTRGAYATAGWALTRARIIV